MKPDWDALMEEFPSTYDVDCTAGGKDLCEEVGVQGFPTIKYGDSSDKKALKAYEGGRDLASLKKFAEENLAPACGPDALDACSAEERTMLDGFLKRSAADLNAEIKKLDKEFAAKYKQHEKKKSKFREKRKDFQDDLEEFSALDKKMGQPGSKTTKAKTAEHKAKKDKVDAKMDKINAEQKTIEAEGEALKEEEKKVGRKMMKSAAKANQGKTDL